MVGTQHRHIGFDIVVHAVVGEVDEDGLVQACARVAGVGIGMPLTILGVVCVDDIAFHVHNHDGVDAILVVVGKDAAKPTVLASHQFLVEVGVLVDASIVDACGLNAGGIDWTFVFGIGMKHCEGHGRLVALCVEGRALVSVAFGAEVEHGGIVV